MSRKRTTAAESRGSWGDEILRLVPDLERRIATTRPQPPDEVAEDVPERFVPDARFAEWLRETFLAGGGPLENETHAHLLDARVGVLWTNAVNVRQMRHVLATAEIPQTMGTVWKRGRAEQQMRDWFHFVPDFVLTFYAPECDALDNRAFCSLVEHELLHCAQAVDQFGAPKFHRDTGAPMYAMRGHDVEVFIEEVERYGVTQPEVARLVRAANGRPSIADASITKACGTCMARAA